MKRLNNVYDEMLKLDNFIDAFYKVKIGKRDRTKVIRFELDLVWNLEKIIQKIKDNNFNITYNTFSITENGKIRIIQAPTLESCIVQHVIYKQVYRIINNRFISNSFACRVGKGIHSCKKVVYKAFRYFNKEQYYLQMDIKKFFYSIDQKILLSILERKYIKDKKLLKLISVFVEDEKSVGIPIGNLLSQIFANVYMHEVDDFLTNTYPHLRYIRYMDDFVLIGLQTYSECVSIKETVIEFIHNNLNLKLSKFKISTIGSGINYAGYRIKQDSIILRRRQYTNFNKHINNKEVINAILSMSKGTTSYKHFITKLKIERENALYDY